jgi:hypothetical protein
LDSSHLYICKGNAILRYTQFKHHFRNLGFHVTNLFETQYLPSGSTEAPGPLGRFLPPTPDGPIRTFLNALKLPGAWVLDPFGASPRMAVEAARAGQRTLVAAGNPVNRFLLDLAAHPPKEADLQAALADLAAARKEDERLETHLQSMYLTTCENCGRELPAEAFLWDSKSGELTGRLYNCVCGSGGEHPAMPEDVQRAVSWSRTLGMHRSRALERVAAREDPDRPFAEEALNIYPPRAVYALGTIINRLDALSTSDERRRCLTALLLWAADATNALWPHLSERPRPRQLTFPGLYRENNIWLALEAGVKAWSQAEAAVPLVLWPEEPPESGGVCIFEGPLRELTPQLEDIPLKAIIAAIPRPNQAFWTLSALWSGWLWGRNAVGPFKAVLRRRRYDWQWHAEALRALFGNLSASISSQTPFFALLTEPEPSFLSATLLAAQTAGLELTGLALRSSQDAVQIHWQKAESSARTTLPIDINFVRKSLREFLKKRAEPAAYLQLHAAALAALADKGMLRWSESALSQVDKIIREALISHEFVDTEKRTNPESGIWGLRKWNEQSTLKGI